mmetsp:Transcript_155784/g.283336  ORF Transcript_155784/g.283336 Transcript_155784/m.283336 type:complete len:260 (+) Transcript_155784:200-979(+)
MGGGDAPEVWPRTDCGEDGRWFFPYICVAICTAAMPLFEPGTLNVRVGEICRVRPLPGPSAAGGTKPLEPPSVCWTPSPKLLLFFTADSFMLPPPFLIAPAGNVVMLPPTGTPCNCCRLLALCTGFAPSMLNESMLVRTRESILGEVIPRVARIGELAWGVRLSILGEPAWETRFSANELALDPSRCGVPDCWRMACRDTSERDRARGSDWNLCRLFATRSLNSDLTYVEMVLRSSSTSSACNCLDSPNDIDLLAATSV